jgi:hypothetical protein
VCFRKNRLPKPIDCPQELYEIMLKCWNFKPEGIVTIIIISCKSVFVKIDRPTFGEIIKELSDKIASSPPVVIVENLTNIPRRDNHYDEVSFVRSNMNHYSGTWGDDMEIEESEYYFPILAAQKYNNTNNNGNNNNNS